MAARDIIFSAAGAAAAATGDPNFEYVTLLLDGNGTNGGQNNTFIDSSSNSFAISRFGNTTQGSFSPYGTLWSNLFNGSTTSLSTTNNAAFDFGTSSFTLEAWIYLTGNAAVDGGGNRVAAIFGCGNTTQTAIVFFISGDPNTTGNGFGIYKNQNTEEGRSVTTTIPQNSWQHIAISKSDSSIRFFLNGTQIGATQTSTTAWGSSSLGTFVGRMGQNNVNWFFPGYISNFRITKSAVYTSNFTPSTTPLTAIANTSLLTCQSNRFIDNSTNNFALTVNGAPSVQRFSPFEPTTSYSTSVIGGSGYFDGTGDYLQLPVNSAFDLGTNACCIEAWVYLMGSQGNQLFCTNGGASGQTRPNFRVDTSGYECNFFGTQFFSGSFNSGTAMPLNTWNHVAITRQGSPAAWRIFVNGKLEGYSATATQNLLQTGVPQNIGLYAGSFFNSGYTTDLRINNGSVPTTYQTSSTTLGTVVFTPPSAPLSPTTQGAANTVLLLKAINASIFDYAMMNDLETVGNAQVSTSVKKFGTGSLAFDGTGDYLFAPSSNLYNIGNGSFTVEFWMYPTAISYGSGSYGLVSANYITNFHVAMINTGAIYFWLANSFITGGTLVANNWYHIACVRNGTTAYIFVNGQQVATGTLSGIGANSPLYIGTSSHNLAETYQGYIDDLRITKGVARYTANFTPPTKAFPTF